MAFILDISFFVWDTVGSLFPFVVLLSLLIFIHEWGHFIIARWCGVKVEVFSLGFGKKLLKKKWGDTVYCISLIPLGGYVKMFGSQYGQEVPENQKKDAFLYKKLWQRTAIVLAGPLMNFILAVFILAGLAVYGEQQTRPVAGEISSSSSAEQAGFKKGDRIVSVNDEVVYSWAEFKHIVFNKPNERLSIQVQTSEGQNKTLVVQTEKQETKNKWGLLEEGGVINGLSHTVPMAVIGLSDPSYPASRAGLKTFDQILSVDGKKVHSWSGLLSAFSKKSLQSYWTVRIKRENAEQTLQIKKPKAYSDIKSLGLSRPDLFISRVKKDSPADKAGLQRGDLITAVNGIVLSDWNALLEEIGGFDQKKTSAVHLSINRNGKIQTISAVPKKYTRLVDGREDKRFMLGIVSGHHYGPAGGVFIKRHSVFTAGGAGLIKALDLCAMTGFYIKKLFTGEISSRTLGGAISIGRVAYDSYSYGLIYFFNIMAILSIQLFLINLLPVPVLDGGHLLFYLCELFNGGPLSFKKVMAAQQIGAVLILFLIIFTTFNDLDNWLNLW